MMRPNIRNLGALIVSAITALVLAPLSIAQEATPRPNIQQLFFESRVRPLLIDNCLNCHSEKRQKGDLRLDSHASLLKGGKHGPAILPGKPDQSRLITAISYEDKDLQMPPDDKLSDDQIKVLTEWVKMGAPWPASVGSIAPPIS